MKINCVTAKNAVVFFLMINHYTEDMRLSAVTNNLGRPRMWL